MHSRIAVPLHLRNTRSSFKDHRQVSLFSGYQLEWEGKKVRVIRPDVECTNGIIHVISAVLLKDSDVRVTGGASLATLAPHLIMILIAKWQL